MAGFPPPSVVDLSLSRAQVSPQDTFTDLADQCTALGITKQDVYGDFSAPEGSSWLDRFETELSEALGKKKGMFLPSGGMAQSIALLVHLKAAEQDKPEGTFSKSFVCHYTSHLLLHEHDCYSKLLNLTAAVIPPVEGATVQPPVTFLSAKPLLDAVPAPFALIVECPHREIGGKCTPYEDLEQLSAYCRVKGIRMHMDGARLWEASAAYNKPLSDICALFDTIYVSFYKGLGGLTGAMLLGTEECILESRIWLRRFGGNLYTLMPYAVSAWAGFRANANAFQGRLKRLQQVVALVTDMIATKYSFLIRFDPPVPEVSLVHVYITTTGSNAATGADAVAWAMQVRDLAAEECGVACFSRLRPAPLAHSLTDSRQEVYVEFNMGPLNMSIADDTWLLGWETFARTLQKQLLLAAGK